MLRLRLALSSNWASLFIRQVLVFSFFGKFLPLLLFLHFVRLPPSAWLPILP